MVDHQVEAGLEKTNGKQAFDACSRRPVRPVEPCSEIERNEYLDEIPDTLNAESKTLNPKTLIINPDHKS